MKPSKIKYKNIPRDFNARKYKELNTDLNHMSDLEAKRHYETIGYKENRKYKIIPEVIPEDFSPTEYKELNTDLQHMTDLEATQHYENFGYKENRKYKDSTIKYKIIKQNLSNAFLSNNLWAHLHCFNIDKFSDYYGEYINKITKYFSIIVTYSQGSIIPNYDFIFLNIRNKGMDIGAKMCCINFINSSNIHYDFILMLHSKSNDIKRREYFDSIILNLENIVPILDMNCGIYTLNILYQGHNSFTTPKQENLTWSRNSIHMNYLIKKLDLPNHNYIFTEGNIYILHKDIANYIFDNKFNLYAKLNYDNSFDYSWFINYYNTSLSYVDAYNKYKKEKLFGNNIVTVKGWSGLADCMIEHAIERIPFGVCKLLHKKIHIINYKKNYELNEYIMNNNNYYKDVALIIACHTSSLLKLKALTNNIKYFKNNNVTNIYIINSEEFRGKIEEEFIKDDFINENFIINNNLTDKQSLMYLDTYADIKTFLKSSCEAKEHYTNFGYRENRKIKNVINVFINYQENTNLICHEKWYNCLKNVNKNYTHYILMNDSFLIISSIDNFINLMNDNEMVGLLDSYQSSHHYPDFLRMYSKKGINKWINFFDKEAKNCLTFYDMIEKFEIQSTYIYAKKDCLYKMPVNYYGNIHFHDEVYFNYINNCNYPVIKLKKLGMTTYSISRDINNTVNSKLPDDFDINMYKMLNVDLNHLNDEELIEHYLKHGVNEQRIYKTIKLPDDFDANNYKMLHPDISHFNEKEALHHFIRHGVYEGRKYKNGEKTVIPEYLNSKLPTEIKECII